MIKFSSSQIFLPKISSSTGSSYKLSKTMQKWKKCIAVFKNRVWLINERGYFPWFFDPDNLKNSFFVCFVCFLILPISLNLALSRVAAVIKIPSKKKEQRSEVLFGCWNSVCGTISKNVDQLKEH